jgi:hypothetical protein
VAVFKKFGLLISRAGGCRFAQERSVRVAVDTESQGKAKQILRAHCNTFHRVNSEFIKRANVHAADFMHKKSKGALRAAAHAQKLLPLADPTHLLLDMALRVMVWRFLCTQEAGAFVERNENKPMDWSLTADPALTVFVAGLIGGAACIGQSYVSVSKHALGRIHQRGGVQTVEELGQAVLNLHDDIGNMSTDCFFELASRAAVDGTFLFPAEGGVWLMSLVELEPISEEGHPEFSLFARSWLSEDDMSPDSERQVEMLRKEVLTGAGGTDAAASVRGPLFPFLSRVPRTDHPATSRPYAIEGPCA